MIQTVVSGLFCEHAGFESWGIFYIFCLISIFLNQEAENISGLQNWSICFRHICNISQNNSLPSTCRNNDHNSAHARNVATG